MAEPADLPITEEWLREQGFRWHQLDRQTEKHWVLWIGWAIEGGFATYEDLGVELCDSWVNRAGERVLDHWTCWLRADYGGRYSRFIHLRGLRTRAELFDILSALVGREFRPEDCFGGSWHQPAQAERLREEALRLDRRMLAERAAWHETERDDSRGRALPEHAQAFHDDRKGKAA